MIGFYGKGQKGLFDIGWNALSWPERLILSFYEPDFAIKTAKIFNELESLSGINALEAKYCSDLTKI